MVPGILRDHVLHPLVAPESTLLIGQPLGEVAHSTLLRPGQPEKLPAEG